MSTTPPAPTAAPRTLSPAWRPKRRYHHGDLMTSAIQRGRELVAERGPDGLTLRGLARDLRVSATALLHHFGSRDGLRSAVAMSVMEEWEATAAVLPRGNAPLRSPQQVGAAWINLATANANLYRLACGEGWSRLPEPGTRYAAGHLGGIHAAMSPRGVLARGLRGYMPKTEPSIDADRTRYYASAIHGMALAGIDGVPASAAARDLALALAAA